MAEGVPLHPGRRVPGHEPRAVPALAAARPEASEPVRGRRPRPVDLRVPRRRPPQHHGVRARLPRHEDDRARAELPLDERDPRGRERGDLEQPRAEAEEPLVRPRRRRPRARRRARGRARGGALRRGRDRAARRGGLQRRRDRGLLPDERSVARARGRARPPGHRVPGDRRAAVLRARGGEGPHLLPPGARQPVRHGQPAADREQAAPRHRRLFGRPAPELRERPRDLALGGDGVPGGSRARDEVGEGGGELPHDDPVADVRARPPGRRHRPGRARALGLHRLARSRAHRRGAGPPREPAGARRRRAGVSASRRTSPRSRRSCRRSRSTPTRTRFAARRRS